MGKLTWDDDKTDRAVETEQLYAMAGQRPGHPLRLRMDNYNGTRIDLTYEEADELASLCDLLGLGWKDAATLPDRRGNVLVSDGASVVMCRYRGRVPNPWATELDVKYWRRIPRPRMPLDGSDRASG